MIETVPHLVWAAATASVAYAGHKVAITWLNHRRDANVRADARAERESDVAAMRDEVKALRGEVKSFLANQRAR